MILLLTFHWTHSPWPGTLEEKDNDGLKEEKMPTATRPLASLLTSVRSQIRDSREAHAAKADLLSESLLTGTSSYDRTELAAAVQEAEQALGTSGRILVRPSGTEPIIRVMVEAVDTAEADRIAHQVAETIRRALA